VKSGREGALTGSQKFTLMKGVSESLAGRADIVELETLSLAEIRGALPRTRPETAVVRGGFPELHAGPEIDFVAQAGSREGARNRVDRRSRMTARMPATNTKPRDEIAGLQFATYRGISSSRHRDACRSVVTGFGLALSVDFIDRAALLSRLHIRPGIPAGIQAARLAPRPLPPAPVPRLGQSSNIVSKGVAARSPQVHPQHGARTTAKHWCSNRIISL
jgi:hypothetical protein